MAIYGMAVSAPCYVLWYSSLDRLSHFLFTSRVHHATASARSHILRSWKILSFKLFADMFLFDPLYLALFFTATSLIEGRSMRVAREKLRDDFLKTYLIDVAVWLPIQAVNFRFIPVIYQPLLVQAVNVGWNAYLSFVQHHT